MHIFNAPENGILTVLTYRGPDKIAAVSQTTSRKCARKHHPWPHCVNISRPRQNCRYFADGMLKCVVLNENVRISLKISLKFVPKFRINTIPALVQIMAWRLPGDTPLSEPMMVNLLTHIYITRPQRVNCTTTNTSHLYCAMSTQMMNPFINTTKE